MSTDSKAETGVDIAKIAAEYSALRSEILKRIGLRQQFISMTLTIAGVFLGIGVTTDTVALVYPLLAAFLAVGWVQNDIRIKQIATYIRERLASTTPYLGWETHVQERREETRMRAWRYVIFSHGGVFIFSQLVAIGIGILKLTATPVEWALLGVDVFAVALVLWVARQARK